MNDRQKLASLWRRVFKLMTIAVAERCFHEIMPAPITLRKTLDVEAVFDEIAGACLLSEFTAEQKKAICSAVRERLKIVEGR